jgi:2-polyprenyl-6-methoxyphenol hydroxylase-like FAD-dependent oxidoreductase
MFHRRDLLKGIYDGLSEVDKSKILVNKNVTSVISSADSVVVRCEDGSSYEGSIVIGADGVNSTTRGFMLQDLAQKTSKKHEHFYSSLFSLHHQNEQDKSAQFPFRATYQLLFGNAPRPASIAAGATFESHGHDASVQLFAGAERAWFFIYSKLATATRERVSYTAADADAYAARFADLPVATGVRLGDVYAARNGAGLTNLDEGVLATWSCGRVVLVGDAAHKLTPNIGWGFNSGVQDLVTLANLLRGAVQRHPGAEVPLREIEGVFAAYQTARMAFMTKVLNLSANVTRISTWSNFIRQMIDNFVSPTTTAETYLRDHVIGSMVVSVPVLDWLEEKHPLQGKMAWKTHPSPDKVAAAVRVAEVDPLKI